MMVGTAGLVDVFRGGGVGSVSSCVRTTHMPDSDGGVLVVSAGGAFEDSDAPEYLLSPLGKKRR